MEEDRVRVCLQICQAVKLGENEFSPTPLFFFYLSVLLRWRYALAWGGNCPGDGHQQDIAGGLRYGRDPNLTEEGGGLGEFTPPSFASARSLKTPFGLL